MKISYCIPVCNEIVELTNLIASLKKNKKKDDEIIILYDSDSGTKVVEEYLRALNVSESIVRWYSEPLNGDFATFKNNFLRYATGDYIVQIDADEIPSQEFFEYIHFALETFDSDVAFIARKNIVVGITEDHIAKWGWRTTKDEGNLLINYPDYQQRVLKNNGEIKWTNKVHEVLYGFKSYGTLPSEMFLWHKKSIERQEKQNEFYEKL